MIGSIIGGIFGKMGADAAAASAEHAAQVQREAQNAATAQVSPWRSAGLNALDEAIELLGLGNLSMDPTTGQYTVDISEPASHQAAAAARFKQDPGYQFRLSEGQKAIDRSLAARGGALSGAGVKAGQRFADNLAQGEYANYFNRLTGIAGMGAAPAAAGAGAITTTAANESNALVKAGDARQSGYNALGTGISRGVSNLLNFF